jgi:glutathione synthase/RimK-type ligase-like ATP-grasp enzyme
LSAVLGLHLSPGSYSDRWVKYCREKGISFKEVDPFRPDFIQQVVGLKAFAWHWDHADPRAVLMARQVTYALEAKGLVVFPNSATCWHFDDKVGQKYLLEAIGAPLVPSYVFYDRESALRWIEHTSFPKVFKLRKGSASSNVRLVRSARQGRHLVARAFREGFNPVASYFSDWWAKLALHRQLGEIPEQTAGPLKRQVLLFDILSRLPRSIRRIARANHLLQKERGYVYFQDFVPDNQFDTRVTIIGRRAFGDIRHVRKGDFRASGSGHSDWNPAGIDLGCIRTAFAVTRKIGAQALAFDFVFGPGRQPLIVEISYACPPYSIYGCPGHWDEALNRHEGHVWPQDAIMEDLLRSPTSLT